MRYSALIRTAACSNAGAGLPRATDRAAFALRAEVGDVRLALIFDADQQSRNSRDLELLRDDQRHRLAAEQDFVVIERTEGRAGGRDLVGIFLVRRRKLGPMLVREH